MGLIPDYSATHPDLSAASTVDWDILQAASAGTGVISGCAVTAQGTPNMTVAVASGVVNIAGVTYSVTANGSLAIGANASGQDRIDLVSVGTSGAPAVTAGTPAAHPKMPALPAANVALAAVYVVNGASAIGASEIVSKAVAIISSKIGETILTASATSIDFSSIPSIYRHLKLLAVLRADVAATTDSVNLIVNNDTTNANYDRQQLTAAGTTVAGAELLAGANARIIAACPAASSPANHFGSLELTVFDYASTSHFKMVHAELSYWANRSTGGLAVRKSVMGWASTAVVNRLTLTPFTGPNFVAGSMATLYGLAA